MDDHMAKKKTIADGTGRSLRSISWANSASKFWVQPEANRFAENPEP
tara:strand:+ start:453 stop:593 length:141 start_codon:yes stop_codon:yes gene_type:complete